MAWSRRRRRRATRTRASGPSRKERSGSASRGGERSAEERRGQVRRARRRHAALVAALVGVCRDHLAPAVKVGRVEEARPVEPDLVRRVGGEDSDLPSSLRTSGGGPSPGTSHRSVVRASCRPLLIRHSTHDTELIPSGSAVTNHHTFPWPIWSRRAVRDDAPHRPGPPAEGRSELDSCGLRLTDRDHRQPALRTVARSERGGRYADRYKCAPDPAPPTQKALIFSTSSQSTTQSMTSAMETSLSTRKPGPSDPPFSSPFVPFPGSADRR